MTPEQRAVLAVREAGGYTDEAPVIAEAIRAALRERDAQVLKLAESAIEEQRIAWINAGEPAWALCASVCKERLRALLEEAGK